jgi:hypothetical protein
MADTPSAFVLAGASTLDGTEHVIISQSGTQRTVALSSLRAMVAASFVLPTADPHVVNALWNNAGTITISAG